MIHVAIIEDQQQDTDNIKQFLARYSAEAGVGIKTEIFENAITFLTNYNPTYDIVFVDIQMPHMDGMEAAAKLREKDPDVPLVFITNMSNYAVKGYSVNAIDFLVKPILYPCFSAMMNKVMRVIENRKESIILKNASGRYKVKLDSVYYIESYGHQIIYHTEDGDFIVWGTVKGQEEKLPKDSFVRCSNYCLVNLRHIDKSSPEGTIEINGQTIPVSRAKRKEFSQKLLAYYSKYL